MKTYIIAEPGSCHGGSIDTACALISAAKSAGADAIKFQWWSSADRLAERRRAPSYRVIYERYGLPRSALAQLRGMSTHAGLDFFCTVYLPEDVGVLAPLMTQVKIASFEAEDDVLVYAAVRAFRRVFISTGMSGGLPQWTRALWARPGGGDPDPSRIVFLHCTSSYPAPLSDLNLGVLRRDVYEGGAYQGLSDHTRHPWTGALAVAAGARYLERHLCLNDTPEENPDYAVASTPAEFATCVANVRLAETMLGDGVKRVMESERAMAEYKLPGRAS